MFRRHQTTRSVHEPVFGLKPQAPSKELLKEWLNILIEENERRIDNATSKQGFFKNGNAAEFVFNTCEKLRVPREAKYLAVELFDKFMIKHVYDFYGRVQREGGDHKKNDWHRILQNICQHIVLRVITCCQLAGKLTSQHLVVTPKRARAALNEFGLDYTMESILQSELRVLKTLHYQVVLQTPMVYVETMLAFLANTEDNLPVKIFHNTGIKILDIIYIKRNTVYDNLFFVVHGHRRSIEDVAQFVRVENDFLLLAVAVICTAAYLTDQTNTDKVIEKLSSLVKIHTNDIIDFTTVIIQLLVEDHEQ